MKKFSISNMSVKAKITMFSVVMLLFMVIIAGVGLFAATTVNTKRQSRYNDYAMAQYYLSEAFTNYTDMKAAVRNQFVRFYAPGVERDYESGRKNFNNYKQEMEKQFGLFEEIMPVYNNKELEAEYANMREILNKWIDGCNSNVDVLVAMGDRNDKDATDAVNAEADNLMTNGVELAQNAKDELAKVCEMVQQESDSNAIIVNRELTTMETILIVVAVIAIIITFAYAILLIRLITVPVKHLSEAAEKMALGDVDVNCSKLSDDDLGVLMDNFSHMVDAIKEQVKIAEMMSAGDMTVDVKLRSDKDVLGKALKKLAEDSNKTLSNVKESTMQVTIGAEQVASASQALAQGSTEQASALQQVTASINEIAENTKKNATEATEANNLVNNVSTMAGDGKARMHSMVEAMTDISESSETISKIIKTIDDIAFQTNILALNAAVEAARAGVHGKGFAVVAEEVRNLAAKSASAASETAEMIEDSIRKVGNGQKLADETAEALDEIVNSIGEVTTLIANIAESSNEQATAVSQIDQAINQVSTVVQTNSATSEECAAASEELSNQAVNLRSQMAGYKLTGGNNDMPMPKNEKTSSFSGGSSHNEQIISLDGEFGKY